MLGALHYAIFWYSKDQVIKTDPVNMMQCDMINMINLMW